MIGPPTFARLTRERATVGEPTLHAEVAHRSGPRLQGREEGTCPPLVGASFFHGRRATGTITENVETFRENERSGLLYPDSPDGWRGLSFRGCAEVPLPG